MKRSAKALACALSLAFLAPGCTSSNDDDDRPPASAITPVPALGKADGVGVRGPSSSVDNTSTRAWLVKNRWEDRDTARARKAGVAWGEDSGLNWDEKYAKWVASMPRIDTPNGYGTTFQLTTPWGKKVASPRLDCADVWIFLRATFAAWYQLPFYLEGWDHKAKKRVYFGHMGIRTGSGRWASTPLFRSYYGDYSARTAAQLDRDGWPKDARLRRRGVSDGDEQPQFGDGARMGTYLDEVHLNKRAAHLIRWLMLYFGTSNLIGGRNTYNLVPEAVRPGDAMLYRRAAAGSGHTMVVMRQGKNRENKLWVEVVSGNVPPRHPSWEGQASSKRRFTSQEGGGPDTNSSGEVYAKIGGGLKRFRVAKLVRGRWMNTWMKADEASWINDTDYERLGKRIEQFKSLLGEVSFEETRDALLTIIKDARRHLRNYPASCAARIRREDAFTELYELMRTKKYKSKLEVDRMYRKKEDYVFALLDYEKSKTCCWNKSNAAMASLILARVDAMEKKATECSAPPVFKATNGGFQPWADYAKSVGQGSTWRPWSADESCPQAGAQNDVEKAGSWSDYCKLELFGKPSGDGSDDSGGTGADSPDAGPGSPDAGPGSPDAGVGGAG